MLINSYIVLAPTAKINKIDRKNERFEIETDEELRRVLQRAVKNVRVPADLRSNILGLLAKEKELSKR